VLVVAPGMVAFAAVDTASFALFVVVDALVVEAAVVEAGVDDDGVVVSGVVAAGAVVAAVVSGRVGAAELTGIVWLAAATGIPRSAAETKRLLLAKRDEAFRKELVIAYTLGNDGAQGGRSVFSYPRFLAERSAVPIFWGTASDQPSIKKTSRLVGAKLARLSSIQL
jgi:hypothetical protein